MGDSPAQRQRLRADVRQAQGMARGVLSGNTSFAGEDTVRAEARRLGITPAEMSTRVAGGLNVLAGITARSNSPAQMRRLAGDFLSDRALVRRLGEMASRAIREEQQVGPRGGRGGRGRAGR